MSSSRRLAQSYMKNRPTAAARVLESLPAEENVAVLIEVPATVAARVLSEMLPTHAARCAECMEAGEMAGILENLAPGHAAVILRSVSDDRRDRILDNLPGLRQRAIEVLLSYPNSMVGAWVEPAVFVVRDSATFAEARKQLRGSSEEVTRRVFILDDRRHLVGEIDLAELARSKRRGTVVGAAGPAPAGLRARSSLRAAGEHPDWSRHLELPVVNRRKEFLGCLYRQSLDQALTRFVPVHQDAPGGLDNLGALLWHGVAGVWTVCSDLMATRRD